MFSTPRKFLVIFLTILQLIAPLIDAHASENNLKQGLHVPGLESYGFKYNVLDTQMKTFQYNVSLDGMIIDVDTGIKQNQTNLQTDSGSYYYLHQKTVVLNTELPGLMLIFLRSLNSWFTVCLFHPRRHAHLLSNKTSFVL